MITNWLKSVLNPNQELFADIENEKAKSTDVLFTTFRPDIAIVDSTSTTLELTICHESNILKSKQFKLTKYRNISAHATTIIAGKLVKNFTIEISTLGF